MEREHGLTPEEAEKACELLTNCCQLLDVIKGEWGESWSEWDQSVRDGASAWLKRYHERVAGVNAPAALAGPATADKADAPQDATAKWRAEDAETGFHWQMGWFFKRMSSNCVRVSHVITNDHGEREVVEQFQILPDEWASIICSVSRGGETSEKFQHIQQFNLGFDVLNPPAVVGPQPPAPEDKAKINPGSRTGQQP